MDGIIHKDMRKHDDVIKWKHFPRYWPFVRGIYRFPVNSTHKDRWRGALMFSLICVWINGWVNSREAGDLRRYRVHYDVTVMKSVDKQPEQNKNVNRIHISFVHSTNGLSSQPHECNIIGDSLIKNISQKCTRNMTGIGLKYPFLYHKIVILYAQYIWPCGIIL